MANDGGQAFPCSVIHYNDEKREAEWVREGGMSLRDWFAGKALLMVFVVLKDTDNQCSNEDAAKTAYAVADAMLAERNK